MNNVALRFNKTGPQRTLVDENTSDRTAGNFFASIKRFVDDDTVNWNALKTAYLANENVRKQKTGQTGIQRKHGVLPKHVLEYLRGLSKVYLKHCEEEFVEHVLPDDEKSLFMVSAFGSTKVTSDYDVQLTGHLAYQLCSDILKGVRPTKTKDGQEWMLAYKFDSNIYIAPYAINADIYDTFPDKVLTDDESMYIPLPTVENGGYAAEIKQILKRIELQKQDLWKDTDNYSKMLDAGQTLDAAYYTRKGATPKPIRGPEFWDCLHTVMLHAAEALCTVSAFICVVHIIQGPTQNKEEKLSNMSPLIRQIAIVENILEYWYHTTNHTAEALSLLYQNQDLQYHKYIKRIYIIVMSFNDKSLLNESLETIYDTLVNNITSFNVNRRSIIVEPLQS